MKREIYFIIPVEPVIWQRAGQQGRRFYDRQEHVKNAHAIYLDQQFDGQKIIQKPCGIQINFFFRKPHYPKYKDFCVGRSDLDNAVKYLFDLLTKAHVWQDDRLAVELCARKGYPSKGTEPRTEIKITEF